MIRAVATAPKFSVQEREESRRKSLEFQRMETALQRYAKSTMRNEATREETIAEITDLYESDHRAEAWQPRWRVWVFFATAAASWIAIGGAIFAFV